MTASTHAARPSDSLRTHAKLSTGDSETVLTQTLTTRLRRTARGAFCITMMAISTLVGTQTCNAAVRVRPSAPDAPNYKVDVTWPKQLPNNWIIGQVGGVAVDRHDNI